MKGLLYLLILITTTLIVIFLNNLLLGGKKQVKKRLKTIQSLDPLSQEEEALRQPISDRLLKPTYQKCLKFISNAAPKVIRQKYEELIRHAGSPKNVTFESILAIQIMFSLFFGLLLYVLLSQTGIIFIIFSAGFGFIAPISIFKVKAEKRQKKITRSLPDLLDLLYVSVEAGLAFDMAMKRTSEKILGPLSDELNRTLEEISRGKSREDALRGLAKRTGVEDVSSLVTSIIQTEQLGSDISNMLRIQSNTMRQRRRQRAEEAARKVPVKMLLPLVFFIFPTLFIVVLGPAAIKIIATLSIVFLAF